MRDPHRALLWLVVGLTLAAVACTSSPPATSAGSTPAIRVTDSSLVPDTVDALPDMDVDEFTAMRQAVAGTPLVVNIWASWCGPCKTEMPMLARAARAHDGGVQFLGVDTLDERGAAREFLASTDVPYPNVFDASGAIKTSLGSIGQPVTVFYDADGNQVAKIDGQLSQSELDSQLRAIGGGAAAG
jgi:thiol-disulfide isomerase/thioredoxin